MAEEASLEEYRSISRGLVWIEQLQQCCGCQMERLDVEHLECRNTLNLDP
ncbi:MAG: hypothetical protein R6U22_08265 [Desulfohalobiaceae bacterium]